LDTDSYDVVFKRVAYDVPLVQRRLLELGCDKNMIAILDRVR
jgi:hypothetical protein